eukprot:m.8261 g.8261  ORF g.8261 m.8261 type:complete len:340 (-) comp4042_c0_seq1:1315-2334(-)
MRTRRQAMAETRAGKDSLEGFKASVSAAERKVLYEPWDPTHDDTAVPRNFLAGLADGVGAHTKVSVGTAVSCATAMVHQHSAAWSVVALYRSLLRTSVSTPAQVQWSSRADRVATHWFQPADSLLALHPTVVGALLGSTVIAVLSLMLDPHNTHGSNKNLSAGSMLGYVVALIVAAPIYLNLAAAVSTNTVHTMAAIFLAGNVLLFDYFGHVERSSAPQVSASALNAGMLATVFLASRLASAVDTFCLVWMATVAFAMWPALRWTLWTRPGATVWDMVGAAVVSATVAAALVWESRALGMSFITLTITLWFILPSLYTTLQSRKRDMSGPWDEAVPSPT